MVIDKIKTIIISLLFIVTLNAQDGVTRFFVDYNAGTSGDGESWATAWKYFGTQGIGDIDYDVDWSKISNGDTIFVSGGTDSLIYIPFFEGQPHYFNQNGVEYTYHPDSTVIICPAFVAGRTDGDWATKNGRVILADTSTQSSQGIVTFGGYLNNVKLYGVTIKDLRPAGSNSMSMFLMFGDDIIFESDTILTAGMGGGGGFGGFNNILRNCVYIEPANETTTASDFMGQFQGKGQGIIEGCKIFIENNYTMINGDANGVSTTDTSLTDTDLNATPMSTDYHKGVNILIGDRFMTITGNNSNTFYGSGGWSSPTGNGIGTTITATTLYYDWFDSTPMEVNEHIGATITCGGVTATVTSNSTNTYTFSGGWSGSTPANGTAYSIINHSAPPPGNWHMEGVHRDIIQYSTQDASAVGENFESIVRNNLIVDQGVRGTGWNSMLYTSSPATDMRFLFYNNIFVNREEISSGGVFLYESRDLGLENTTGTGVTVTDTSLTDVALNMTINSKVDKVIYCGGRRAFVTSNNATTLYFEDGWSTAGLPSNGFISGSTPANGLPYRDIKTSLRFFNNTIITKGDAAFDGTAYTSTIPVSIENMDTLYFKNNIVIVDTMHKTFIRLSENNVFGWDNNIYASDGYNYESFAYDGSPVRTWDNWVAQGYDVTNSDTTNPANIVFVEKYGRDIEDYYTGIGTDLGDDLTDMPDYAGILARHPDIIKDILGNDRVVPYDIGALEFQQASPTQQNKLFKTLNGMIMKDLNGKIIK